MISGIPINNLVIEIGDQEMEVTGRYFEGIDKIDEPSRFNISKIRWQSLNVTELVLALRGKNEIEEICLTELDGD